jgi:hypothetical protein
MVSEVLMRSFLAYRLLVSLQGASANAYPLSIGPGTP